MTRDTHRTTSLSISTPKILVIMSDSRCGREAGRVCKFSGTAAAAYDGLGFSRVRHHALVAQGLRIGTRRIAWRSGIVAYMGHGRGIAPAGIHAGRLTEAGALYHLARGDRDGNLP